MTKILKARFSGVEIRASINEALEIVKTELYDSLDGDKLNARSFRDHKAKLLVKIEAQIAKLKEAAKAAAKIKKVNGKKTVVASKKPVKTTVVEMAAKKPAKVAPKAVKEEKAVEAVKKTVGKKTSAEADRSTLAVFKNIGKKNGLTFEEIDGNFYQFGDELNCLRTYYLLSENYKVAVTYGKDKTKRFFVLYA